MPLSWRKKGEAPNPSSAGAPAAPPDPTSKRYSFEDLAKIRACLEKLPPADRTAAEEQWLCPVRGDVFGSMGVPVKVTLNGTPVFLCCKGCLEEAQKNPDKTLKAVAEAKAKSGAK